jgi:hypothetical protein
VRGAYQTADWNNNARIVQVGRDLNPEVGFLNRTGGYRFAEVAAMRFVRKAEWKWLKDWNPHMSYRGYYGLDGSWQNGQVHADFTELEFANGSRFGPEINVFHEGLTAPFAIAPGVTLPVGSYDYTVYGLDWTMNPSAPFSFVLRGDFGPFYNGIRNGGNVNFTYRRGATLSTVAAAGLQRCAPRPGRVHSQADRNSRRVFLHTAIFAQSLVQYSSQARVWTANARFGWLGRQGPGCSSSTMTARSRGILSVDAAADAIARH